MPQRNESWSAESTVLSLANSAGDAATPRCRHFGKCGGCQLQHVAYPAQTDGKSKVLAQALQRRGVTAIPSIMLHSAEPWAYRNRIRFRVEGDEVGYSRRASNDFLPIAECTIASPLLVTIALEAASLAREGKAPWPQATTAVELFTDAAETAVEMTLQLDANVLTVDRGAPAQLRRLCELLQAEHPQLIGAGISVAAAADPSLPRRVQEARRVEIARWGRQQIDYTVGGHTHRITRGGFFQVNRFLTAAMVDTVLGNRSGESAMDLFAGAGLFSVPLTGRFAQVTAVEIGEPAYSDLSAALAAHGSKHRAVHGTAQEFLRGTHASPDLLVVDPPRAGLGPAVTEGIARLHPREIVYVACNPATFADDAARLIKSGYSLVELHAFDLFPQTFHIESIAVLRG